MRAIKRDDHSLISDANLALRTISIRLRGRLEYSTLRVSSAHAAQQITLTFNIDYNLTDMDSSFQDRLVYEPYYTQTVVTGVWQTWNTLDSMNTGNWWATGGIGVPMCPI
jgi:hypothetical protein